MKLESSGFTPKQLTFDTEGREKLVKGIEKLARAVKSTLGPMGQTVLIESADILRGITVTKDGVTVAKSIDLIDPVENLAVRIMKEAADKTAASAGDGTTTAIVLTEALVKAGFEQLNNVSVNKTETLRHLVEYTKDIVQELKKMSKKVTKKNLIDVATISSNNDTAIGKIIADTYKQVGKDGYVTLEKSLSTKTYTETTKGIKVDRGYSNPLFINNQKKDECVLEDVNILVSDAEISNILQIENILKPIINERKKLLIIAPCTQPVLNTLAANVMKSKLSICVIQPPNFGYRQHELMQDIALAVNATYFSEKTGDDLSLIKFSDLGHAQKTIVGVDKTVILNNDIANSDEIKLRVKELQEQIENTKSLQDKEFIRQRIASLTGGIGVIYVGGNTDLEQKELYDRVEDAVCAVRSALEEGILPGGGVALFKLATQMIQKKYIAERMDDENQSAAIGILYLGLLAPLEQILDNAGREDVAQIQSVIGKHKNNYYGFDLKQNRYGNLLELGVIDPMKVTKCALQNAVSVAVTLLSTNAIVTMARTYESNK